jgi:hypothetical protein
MILNMLRDMSHNKPIRILKTNLRRLDNVGFWDFSGSVVWDGNDGTVGDVRVGEKMGFEFGRRDL